MKYDLTKQSERWRALLDGHELINWNDTIVKLVDGKAPSILASLAPAFSLFSLALADAATFLSSISIIVPIAFAACKLS